MNARKVKFFLGDTELSGYLIEGLGYRLSKTEVSTLCGFDKRRLSELLEKKVAQSLMPHGLEVVRISTEEGKIDGISITDACTIAVIALTSNYEKAVCLAGAAIAEVLERRLDQAFQVKRTEEERNERFKTRAEEIFSRHFYTDVIQEWVRVHRPNANPAEAQRYYIQASDGLNRRLFGKTSKEIKAHFKLKPSEAIRDFLPAETLRLIGQIERTVGMMVQTSGGKPFDVMCDLLPQLGITEPNPTLLGK
jgi:hypothetical protein